MSSKVHVFKDRAWISQQIRAQKNIQFRNEVPNYIEIAEAL